MFGQAEGGNPIMDYLRSRAQNWRAHPFQQGAGVLAGMFGGPAASQLAQMGFNRFNNSQFNGSVNQANQNLGNQIDSTNQGIWDKPVNGPLGEVPGGQGNGGQDRELAQALSGGGGYNGPTQSPFAGNYGNNYGQGSPSQTSWSQPGNPGGLLDFLGPAPQQQPGQGGPPMNHQELMDHLQNQQNQGPPALYGVSNFMVGGAPVINGVRPAGGDMNGMAMAHHFLSEG